VAVLADGPGAHVCASVEAYLWDVFAIVFGQTEVGVTTGRLGNLSMEL